MTGYVLDTVPAFSDWYKTKFDSDGNVRPEWRHDTWTKTLDLPKTPSPGQSERYVGAHPLFSGNPVQYHADQAWRADIPKARG